MDWLSCHYAIVDCFKKVVDFDHPGEAKFSFQGLRHTLPSCLISTIIARKMLRKGCQAYLAYVVDTKFEGLKLENIPIVCEFRDVFPEDLLGLPPDREIEFSIYVIPSTASISQVPYRMTPIGLKELKIQL